MTAVPQGCNSNCDNSTYAVTPLISNISGIAPNTYASLKNPWALVVVNGSIWITDELVGALVNYSSDGIRLGTVTVVPGANVPSGETALPRGLAVNTSTITSGSPASPVLLLISTRQGTINVYNPTVSTTEAPVVIDNSAKSYEYADILVANNQIYVVNITNKNVEIYDTSYTPVTTFTDPALTIISYCPLGLMTAPIGYTTSSIYVTFIATGTTDLPVAGVGRGFVDVFSPDGSSSYRLINRGHLNVPHAMAIIPVPVTINGVSQVINALAIANRGDGKIGLYDPLSGSYIGTLNDAFGNPIIIDKIGSLVNLGPNIVFLAGTEIYEPSAVPPIVFGEIGYLENLTQVLMNSCVTTTNYYTM